MTGPDLPSRVWETVLPVCDDHGFTLGTGVVVAPCLVLTALHVVKSEPAPRVTDHGLAITAFATLRPRQFGRVRRLASRSLQRANLLTGQAASTVDLALLAVPDLDAPPLPTRHTAVRTDEMVTVPGYPYGERTASHGPITSADEADFVAHVCLGPGMSGAPAIDRRGRLAGLISMDHPTAGAISIGPTLITAFLSRAGQKLRSPAGWLPAGRF